MEATAQRQKYAPKAKIEAKYGYNFDETAIDIRTIIPELPIKPKHKPDPKIHARNIDDLKAKSETLKAERAVLKDSYKRENQEITDRIDTLSDHAKLGANCINVLGDMKGSTLRKLRETKQRLHKVELELAELQTRKMPHPGSRSLEEMSFEQLCAEESRCNQLISLGELSNPEERRISGLLLRIANLKVEARRSTPAAAPDSRISTITHEIKTLQAQRSAHQTSLTQLDYKITCITEDIASFAEQRQKLEQQKRSSAAESLYNESQAKKEDIRKIRAEIARCEDEFERKEEEHAKEQELIKWINWAREVKKRKEEEWESEKEVRKAKKKQEKEAKKTGTEVAAEPTVKKPERREPLPYEKEIDTCTFLIAYCRALCPAEEQAPKEDGPRVNLEEAIRSGAYGKGLEIIQPKKMRAEDEPEPKRATRKQKQQPAPSSELTHQYFELQAFEALKILPPSKPEELEPTIKQLEDLSEYYASKVDAPPRAEPERREYERPQGKRNNAKALNDPREFPTLD